MFGEGLRVAIGVTRMGWGGGPSRQDSVDAQLVPSSRRADLHLHFAARVKNLISCGF